MFIISLCLSAVLLFITNLAARSSRSALVAAGVACLGIIPGACFLSPALVLNALLLTVTGVVLAARQARPTMFLPASLVVTVFFYVGVSIHSFVTYRDLERRFPAVPLEDRLAYEDADRDPEGSARRNPQPNSELVLALENQIKREQRGRPLALKQLHENTVEAFVSSPGFGVGRGTPNLRLFVELSAIESIPQPSPPEKPALIPPESRLTFPPDVSAIPVEASRAKGLHQLHEQSLLSFVNIPGFGYVKGRQSVGFQEHHFRAVPSQEDRLDNLGTWQVDRVELVSLLKHPEPRVYLSDNLPRMDELRTAQTRELNDFEASRLPDLVKGADLASGRAGDTVYVLGAIRAANQCLDCHSVQRGDLLGAFSYRLRVTSKGR